MAATLTGTTAYGHGVAELFPGRGLVNRYFRFAATGAPGGGGGGSLIIENGARIIAAKPNVSVSFPGITNPTEYDIRWRWGQEPTDAASDSSGWQTLSANPFAVPISQNVNVGDCVADTLFAQLRRKATPNSPLGVVQGSIIVDNAVNVSTQISNPNMASRASTFTSGTGSKLADLNKEGGARDGDALYTRQPSVMVQVSDLGDCSKAQNFTIVRNTLAAGPYGLTNGNFSAPVPIPDFATLVPGDITIAVRVRDEPGNVNEATQTMVYDTAKPVLNSGDLAVTPRSDGNILVTLNFTNLSVSDNLYPRDATQRTTGGYWGVWVANSPTPVSNPTTDENLVWTPVSVSQRGAGTATVSNWSLLTGLSTQQIASVRPGQPYTGYIYVRFLDGAGNPSDAFRAPASAVQLQQVSFPRTFLPIVGR
ncbi:MAG: hypothetical protein MUD01_13140 [Chloroflexaceae bacterium]|nr:hypothetical protein [Chloroflexaceae bacterium]